MTRTIELIAVGVALLIAALALHAWIDTRDDQRRLQSTLAAQKQLIDAADARETSRDATLTQTLAQIDALKRATQTPAEILRDLPRYLSLPAPIELATQATQPSAPPVPSTPPRETQSPASGQQGTGPHPETGTAGFPPSTFASASKDALAGPSSPSVSASASGGLPSSPASQATAAAEIPAADLKPLYDYVQDCRACQARIAAATQNISDDDSKITALTRERDAAVTASKGGSLWQRLRRDALWLAIGAGLGYAAHR